MIASYVVKILVNLSIPINRMLMVQAWLICQYFVPYKAPLPYSVIFGRGRISRIVN